MFEKIVKAILNPLLHLAIKNSDVEDFELEVRETDEKYFLAINSRVLVGKNGVPVRKKGKGSRNLAIAFVILVVIMASFIIAGMLSPNPVYGRSLLFISDFPAFVVNMLGARYLIKSIT